MSKKQNKKVLAILAVSAFACVGLGANALNNDVVTANADSTMTMVTGASVRLADDFYGLRFKMAVTPSYYETNNAGSYGMLIIPEDYLTTYEAQLTAGNNDYVTVLSDIKKADSEDYIPLLNITNMEGYSANAAYEATEDTASYICFNGVIASIKYDNLDREFVGIGYYYNGTSYDYATFTTENNSRSVVEVAGLAIKDNAVATTDIYTADEVLRLYEYTFLNDQKANSVEADDAAEAYTQYKAGLKTQYQSTVTNAYNNYYQTLVDKTGVDMQKGDVLSVEFDIVDAEFTSHPSYNRMYTGFVIGNKNCVFDDNLPFLSGCLVTTWVYGANDGTWRLYKNGDASTYRADGSELVGTRTGSYTLTGATNGLWRAGKSTKIVFKPYYAEDDLGWIELYTKNIGETEWTLAVSYTDLDDRFAYTESVRISLSSGNLKNIVIDNYATKVVSGGSTTTYTELVNYKSTAVKGNLITVDNQGALSTQFVAVGKALALAGGSDVEWTVNDVAYDVTTPIFAPITIKGTIPPPTVYAKYNLDMTSTAAEICFGNMIALPKGKNMIITYTYGDANYTAAAGGVLWAITASDTQDVSFGAAKKYYIINNGDAQVYWTKNGNSMRYEFIYNSADDTYTVTVFLNGGGTGLSAKLPASAYFGITFIRINGSIPITNAVCNVYGEGTLLGIQGNSQVTVTPVVE